MTEQKTLEATLEQVAAASLRRSTPQPTSLPQSASA
jgi:hypothetical protein